MPVPTAVPPCGSRRMRLSASSMRSIAEPICAAQPDSSWPKVIGIASIRWVRPVLAVFFSSRARRSMVFFRCFSAGSSSSARHQRGADVDRGGDHVVGALPVIDVIVRDAPCAPPWPARCAITSLAFMLVLVPEPVWNTSIGNWSSNWPSATASAALRIAVAWFFFRWPSCQVGLGRGRLDQPQRADEAARQRQAGDREIVDRPLGLRAVQRVGGHLQFAHAVVFDAETAHGRSPWEQWETPNTIGRAVQHAAAPRQGLISGFRRYDGELSMDAGCQRRGGVVFNANALLRPL